MAARLILLLVILIPTSFATAQPGEDPDPQRWRITPYLWVPEIAGSSTADGSEALGHLTLFDVLELFGFLTVEGGTEKWRLRGDLMFLALEGDWDRPPNTGFDLDIWIIEFAALYRVLSPAGENPWIPAVDLFAGARIYSVDLGLEFIGFEGSGVEEWIDPIVGARAGWKSGKWRFDASADIGGFDVGSDLAWQAFVGVGYAFTRTFELGLSYRVLDIEASFDGGADLWELDLQLRGPQLNFAFSF